MQTQAIDYSRKWSVMAAVSAGVFLATLDTSIVNIAMPTLERVLDTNFAIVQWVALSYLLTITTLLLSIGRLADIVGKKHIYTIGFVIFTIGSALCGVAPDVGWLIAFRVIQAIGAAMIMALGPALITEAFPETERGQALGIIGLAVSVGIIAGPVLGGLLLDALSWHWIFLINVPLGIISTFAVARLVPDIKPPGGQRFDYVGAVTLFVSLLALLLALTFGQQQGFREPLILLLFAAWLLFLAWFVVIELRSSQPMIDLRIFQNSMFTISLISGFITFLVISGVFFLIPFYLENMRGYDPLFAGQLLAVVPITLGITAPISGWLSDRFGPHVITSVGLLILLLGYTLLSQLDAQTSTLAFILYFLPIGTGMGVFQSPNNSAIMGTVASTQLGIASGMLAISRTLGQTTGIALLNALWASQVLYHAHGEIGGEATAAPIESQVAGLQDTFLVIMVLIGLALLLNIWTWVQAHRLVLQEEAR